MAQLAAAATPAVHEVPFTFLASGEHSPTQTRAFLRAFTPEQLQAIWNSYSAAPAADPGGDPWPLPQVDFTRYTVLAYFGGWSDYCSANYHVSRVLEYPDKLTVELVSHPPAASWTCAGAASRPWEVLQLASTPKPIDYLYRTEPRPCGQAAAP